ncbi:MAG: PCMD domain-containing protein [Paraprevotella sp.]|nr:PCMD domain-containing protein [Paraprevotella sp.]
MKKTLLGLYLFSALLWTSCIRNEPMNSECDIETATVVTDHPEALFFNTGDVTQSIASSDTVIAFSLKENFKDSDMLKSLPISFKITPGAVITPENGSPQDFSGKDGVTYYVTSEDRQWYRTYHVKFVPIRPLVTDLSFEHFSLEPNGRYYEWYEQSQEGSTIDMWATGNPGYAISRSSAKPDEFPTLPWCQDSIRGHCVKLETCDTGPFGVMVNMRIAAGNLFIGTFDVSNALKDAMAATLFGLPFNRKPVSFEGYYKYKAGDRFQNQKGTIQEGRVDQPDIYAVLYKNTDENGNSVLLKGDDVLTNPNIVALARIQNPVHDFDTWTYFNLPFEYYSPIDENRMKSYGYNLAVVFTSSIEGASFCGAEGSTLLVDEVKVICNDEP